MTPTLRGTVLTAAVALAAIVAVGPTPRDARAADPIGEGFLAAPIDEEDAVQEGRLSPDNIATVTRIEDYLNDMSSVRARFLQISLQGNYAEGELYLERPGKLRFEYDPPHPVLLIADGSSFLYYDKELKNATFIPLEDSPLWFLIRAQVSLTDDLEITRIIEEDSTITLTLRGEATGDLGEVTLVFADQPMELKKWIVTDAEGISIQVALIEPQFQVQIDETVFDYGDLDVYGFRGNENLPKR